MTVSPLSIHNTLCANGGGTYRKGKLYFTSYYEDMTGALTPQSCPMLSHASADIRAIEPMVTG